MMNNDSPNNYYWPVAISFITMSTSQYSGLDKADSQQEINFSTTGRFVYSPSGYAIYVESIKESPTPMSVIFIAKKSQEEDAKSSAQVIRAEAGRVVSSSDGKSRYLELNDGTIVQMHGNSSVFSPQPITNFSTMGQRLKPSQSHKDVSASIETIDTLKLIQDSKEGYNNELYRRFSIIVLVVIIMPILFTLSRTTSRIGRYVGLLPMVMVYIVYLAFINSMAVTSLSPGLYFLLIHIIFAFIAMSLF